MQELKKENYSTLERYLNFISELCNIYSWDPVIITRFSNKKEVQEFINSHLSIENKNNVSNRIANIIYNYAKDLQKAGFNVSGYLDSTFSISSDYNLKIQEILTLIPFNQKETEFKYTWNEIDVKKTYYAFKIKPDSCSNCFYSDRKIRKKTKVENISIYIEYKNKNSNYHPEENEKIFILIKLEFFDLNTIYLPVTLYYNIKEDYEFLMKLKLLESNAYNFESVYAAKWFHFETLEQQKRAAWDGTHNIFSVTENISAAESDKKYIKSYEHIRERLALHFKIYLDWLKENYPSKKDIVLLEIACGLAENLEKFYNIAIEYGFNVIKAIGFDKNEENYQINSENFKYKYINKKKIYYLVKDKYPLEDDIVLFEISSKLEKHLESYCNAAKVSGYAVVNVTKANKSYVFSETDLDEIKKILIFYFKPSEMINTKQDFLAYCKETNVDLDNALTVTIACGAIADGVIHSTKEAHSILSQLHHISDSLFFDAHSNILTTHHHLDMLGFNTLLYGCDLHSGKSQRTIVCIGKNNDALIKEQIRNFSETAENSHATILKAFVEEGNKLDLSFTADPLGIISQLPSKICQKITSIDFTDCTFGLSSYSNKNEILDIKENLCETLKKTPHIKKIIYNLTKMQHCVGLEYLNVYEKAYEAIKISAKYSNIKVERKTSDYIELSLSRANFSPATMYFADEDRLEIHKAIVAATSPPEIYKDEENQEPKTHVKELNFKEEKSIIPPTDTDSDNYPINTI